MKRSHLLKSLFGVNALLGLAVGYLLWRPIFAAEMPVWMPWLVAALHVLSNLLGFSLTLRTPIPIEVIEETEPQTPVEVEPVRPDEPVVVAQEFVAPVADEANQLGEPDAGPDTTTLFLERFYERFGSFYSDIQRIEGQPDDDQKR